jgi:hypothetical protein
MASTGHVLYMPEEWEVIGDRDYRNLICTARFRIEFRDTCYVLTYGTSYDDYDYCSCAYQSDEVDAYRREVYWVMYRFATDPLL